MKIIKKLRGGALKITLTSLIAALCCTGIIYAATTVGTNISTTGTIIGSGANTLYGATSIGGALTATSTLTVTGLTTLGNASTTLLSISGNLFLNTASSTGIVKFSIINSDTGAISFGDENLSTTGTLNITGLTTLSNASTTVLSVSGNSYLATTTLTGDLTVAGNTTVQDLFIGGQPLSATAARLQSKGETVRVAGYSPSSNTNKMDPSYITGGVSFNTTGTYVEIFMYNWLGRLRSSAPVTGIQFYAKDNWSIVNSFVVKLWRLEENDNTYKVVGAIDVCPGNNDCVTDAEITENAVNTLTFGTSIPDPQPGDFVSFALTKSATTAGQFWMMAIGGNPDCRYVNTAPGLSGVDWLAESQCQGTGGYMPHYRLYGDSPVTVYIGESFLVGGGSTCSYGTCNASQYADDTSPITNEMLRDHPDWTLPWMTSKLLGGDTYQNMGIGGETISDISARLTADVVNLKPRRVVLVDMWNDLNTGTTISSYETTLTSVLDTLKTNNIIPIISLGMPSNGWAGTTNIIKHVKREILNDWLIETVKPAYNAIIFDPRPYVGADFDLSAANQWTTNNYIAYSPVVPTVSNNFWYYTEAGGNEAGATEPTWCLYKNCTVTSDQGVVWKNGGSINNKWKLASWAVLSDNVHLTKDGYSALARGLVKAMSGGVTPKDKLISTYPDGDIYGNLTPQADFSPWAIMITPDGTVDGVPTSFEVLTWATLSTETNRPGDDNNDMQGYGCDVNYNHCMPKIPGDYDLTLHLTSDTGLAAGEEIDVKIIKDEPYHIYHSDGNNVAYLCNEAVDMVAVEGLISGAFTVINLTDGSSMVGTIASGVPCDAGTNNRITGTLSGGTNNDFEVGDHIIILDADCGGSADTIIARDRDQAVDANDKATINIQKTIWLDGVDDWVAACVQSDSVSTLNTNSANSYFQIKKK